MRKSRRANTGLSNMNPRLDLSLIRLARKRGVKMPQTMGSTVDSYEAILNDLQLQIDMLATQASSEVAKGEVLTNQIIEQVKIAEASVVEQLNTFSKELVDQVSSQVAASELSVKFDGTNVFDMSFITNLDYSKVAISNDGKVLQSRIDNREVYRNQMVNMKAEVLFHQGLIKKTRANDWMMPNLYNARNYYLREYYLACIRFYQEATIIGFLYNPTNNIENLKEYIKINEENIPLAKQANENKRFSIGETAYNEEVKRLKYIERMLVTAKYRLKYVQTAFAGKWTPPTFDSLLKIAEEKNLTLSRVVYDLNEYTRQTLCVPDWILGIAEMYNQVEVFDQGADVVPLNPYNPIWIRKAKEVMNLESKGVVNTSQKLFACIDKYWEVLTGGFQTIEDAHLDAIIIKAKNNDNTPVTGYDVSTDYDILSFDEDQQMGGFFKKIFKAVASVARAIVEPMVSVGGVVLKAASPITQLSAKALKFTLDNTLGRVLPDSIYGKISSFTNASAAILEGNLKAENFRAVVKGVMDVYLIGIRINKEILNKVQDTGIGKMLDKYSGGLLTSVNNLQHVAIALETNALTDEYTKIDWMRTLIDAIKVGAAVYAGASLVSTQIVTNIVGTETGLNKTSLGAGFLTAAALMTTGQADFSQVATSGATKIGSNALINNTALGDSQLGRTAVELGAVATSNSINANTAFSDEMRNVATAKAKEIATKEANEKLRDVTGLPINVNMLTDVYDFATGDKTIAQVLEEAQQKFTAKYDELVAKAEKLTVEEIQDRAEKEADKFVVDQLDKAKNKYGTQMFNYLLSKYGPKMDYADVATPDDYLNYQIYTPPANKRIINVVYKKNNKVIGTVLVAGAAVSLYALS